jgi:hypothetical protein
VQKLSIDNRKRIPVEYNALSARKKWRIEPWPLVYTVESGEKLLEEAIRHSCA